MTFLAATDPIEFAATQLAIEHLLIGGLRQARDDLRARPESGRGRAAWFKARAARDPVFRLNRNMRSAINASLRGTKRGRRWHALVGYSVRELAAHLEAQFTDGMNWANIGDWHVDHRRPLASFTITGPDCPEFKVAWALTNLQPLWALDNLRKGARWTP